MNQKVCENHLYVKNPSLTLANRQSYRLAQGLSKLAPNAASETRRETMVRSEEANDTTVFSRRGKAAAFSERQRRVVHALVTFQKRRGSEKPKACRDQSPQTADAGIYDGMGVLSSWFLRAGCNRAGDGRSFRETSVER